MSNLDDLYGPCVKPERLFKYEHNSQASATKLDASTGHQLPEFVKYAMSDAFLGRHLCDGFNTLWLIDESGDIRIALEEVVLKSTPDIISAPMPRGLRSEDKLGHPALVEGRPARIGGELTLDRTSGTYYISNSSGRYGRMRTEAHLRRAAELFGRYGVDVTVDFLQSDLL